LYAALFAAKLGQKILLLERENAPFSRATWINQARVHMGYHYPRSFSTAAKSRAYFDRFNEDFAFCVNSSFDQVYAISSNFSWTSGAQFQKFCSGSDIMCEPLNPEQYFNKGMCEAAFLTKEYTYDGLQLRDRLIKEISVLPNITLAFGAEITGIESKAAVFHIKTTAAAFEAPFVLNATYASVNQIHRLLGYEPFKIKYELCEIILCNVSDNFSRLGLTVMDGMFFSIMPFGNTGRHSLTAVCHTPHITSFDEYPAFPCQENAACSPDQLENCNDCPNKPPTAFPNMSALARKYIKEKFKFEYVRSLFSMKPILKASEIDDSRPTVIKKMSGVPAFYSVLSGKINTVYDLDDILK
jgi:hypothetical protein